MINAEVQKLIDKGVNYRTAYRRVGKCSRGIIPEVKAFILQGYTPSWAYRKYKRGSKKSVSHRNNERSGAYAFSTGEFV